VLCRPWLDAYEPTWRQPSWDVRPSDRRGCRGARPFWAASPTKAVQPMIEQPSGAEAVEGGEKKPQTPRRRGPVLRSVVLLVVTTVALVVFTLLLGDMRRKKIALDRADWYAARLADRAGPHALLPLNLQVDCTQDLKTKTYAVEWLSRQDAYVLRRSEQRVIAAQTVPISRYLAADGRAVVFFQKGRFKAQWLPLSQFDEFAEAQREEIRRRSGTTDNDFSEPPL